MKGKGLEFAHLGLISLFQHLFTLLARSLFNLQDDFTHSFSQLFVSFERLGVEKSHIFMRRVQIKHFLDCHCRIIFLSHELLHQVLEFFTFTVNNFSSDIDLIFTFPEHGETVGGRRSLDNQQFFIRMGQRLVNLLDQVTVDGFVHQL